jgi:hypothetical protein
MSNTIRYFQYKEAEWLRRAERNNIQTEGHRCYAYKQADVWKTLARRAQMKFGSNAV